jgi:hypothetical protein
VSNDNFLPTCGENLSVPSLGACPLNIGPIGYPETSVRNYRYSLRNNPDERVSDPLRNGRLKSRHEIFMYTKPFLLSFIEKNELPPIY